MADSRSRNLLPRSPKRRRRSGLLRLAGNLRDGKVYQVTSVARPEGKEGIRQAHLLKSSRLRWCCVLRFVRKVKSDLGSTGTTVRSSIEACRKTCICTGWKIRELRHSVHERLGPCASAFRTWRSRTQASGRKFIMAGCHCDQVVENLPLTIRPWLGFSRLHLVKAIEDAELLLKHARGTQIFILQIDGRAVTHSSRRLEPA